MQIIILRQRAVGAAREVAAVVLVFGRVGHPYDKLLRGDAGIVKVAGAAAPPAGLEGCVAVAARVLFSDGALEAALVECCGLVGGQGGRREMCAVVAIMLSCSSSSYHHCMLFLLLLLFVSGERQIVLLFGKLIFKIRPFRRVLIGE